MEKYVTNTQDLTPIEYHNNICFKRDDLYQPYEDLPINGSKVRQHQWIKDANASHIVTECDNKVYSALFLSSCQSAVIARVYRDLNTDVTIFHGGTNLESIKKNKIALNAVVNKAKIDVHLKSGYASVLKGEINKRKESGEKFFNVSLEEYAEQDAAMLWTTAHQVQNLPKLDTLYVPSGSGLTLIGVLMGLLAYNIPVNKVVGLNISGRENSKILTTVCKYTDRDINDVLPFEFIQVPITIPYHKRVKYTVDLGFSLDSIYEAKAYLKMLEIYNPEENNGFWVSGNMDPIRDKVYNLKKTLQEVSQ